MIKPHLTSVRRKRVDWPILRCPAGAGSGPAWPGAPTVSQDWYLLLPLVAPPLAWCNHGQTSLCSGLEGGFSQALT